jgi:hypothetical protein
LLKIQPHGRIDLTTAGEEALLEQVADQGAGLTIGGRRRYERRSFLISPSDPGRRGKGVGKFDCGHFQSRPDRLLL